MKGSYGFALFIILFLGIMFAIECSLPKRFVWNPTYGHNDKQPFGCALFDESLTDAWSQEYTLSHATFYQLAADTDTVQPRAIMAVAQNLNLSEPDVNALIELAHRGNKILLASLSFGNALSDTLGFECSYSYFSVKAMKSVATSLHSRDTLQWVGDTLRYAARNFRFYPQLCPSHFVRYDSLTEVLARNLLAIVPLDSTKTLPPPVAISCPVGRGEIILVSTPLLLTNYALLDGSNATYAWRLLSQLQPLPLVRTEAYGVFAQEQESPFRYFLSQPALRWGLYLTLISIVLFMVNSAHRQQRAIPVIRQPENNTLEFTKLIGTLYFQQKNPTDLVVKQYIYFAETLRRELHIDVDDDSDDKALGKHLAEKTGKEEAAIRGLLYELRPLVRGEKRVDNEQMKRLIDQMLSILQTI